MAQRPRTEDPQVTLPALSETRTEIGPGKTSFSLKRPSPDSAKGPKRRLEIPLTTACKQSQKWGAEALSQQKIRRIKQLMLIGKSVITIYCIVVLHEPAWFGHLPSSIVRVASPTGSNKP